MLVLQSQKTEYHLLISSTQQLVMLIYLQPIILLTKISKTSSLQVLLETSSNNQIEAIPKESLRHMSGPSLACYSLLFQKCQKKESSMLSKEVSLKISFQTMIHDLFNVSKNTTDWVTRIGCTTISYRQPIQRNMHQQTLETEHIDRSQMVTNEIHDIQDTIQKVIYRT